MKKEIRVRHGQIVRIAKTMGHDPQTVRFALRGMTESETAEEIRKVAIRDFGGKLC